MSKLKFIVDECLGFLITHWLLDQGYDAISAITEMKGAKDTAILSKFSQKKQSNSFSITVT